jgi:predicted O-methyltransferase YrrM
MLEKTLAMLDQFPIGTTVPEGEQCFDKEEIAEFGNVLARLIYAPPQLRKELQDRGATITRSDFYSEIPTIKDMERPSPLKFEAAFPSHDVMLRELAELDKYAHEFDPPKERQSPAQFSWEGGIFSYSDAMAYYCMVRSRKPKRIIEIGSGSSTLIAKQACQKNGFGEIICIEPYPSDMLREHNGIELIDKKVQEVETEFFNDRLEDGDVLFIDSTHTVKHDSDCLHIYLRILPAIRASIIAHAHDINLPGPLPISMMRDEQIFWNEQYLLYAYLLENPRTEVLYGGAYHSLHSPEQLNRFMRGRYKAGGRSFWFTQRAR